MTTFFVKFEHFPCITPDWGMPLSLPKIRFCVKYSFFSKFLQVYRNESKQSLLQFGTGVSVYSFLFSVIIGILKYQHICSEISLFAPYLLSLFLKFYQRIVDIQCSISGVHQSESVIHIYIPFQILFLYWSLQNIEQISLGYTVGHCNLFT